MKKNRLAKITLAFLILVSIIFGLFFILRNRAQQPVGQSSAFSLSSEFYGHGEFQEINADKFAQLIKEKKSFVIVARMLFCPANMPMATNAESVSTEENITIFSLYQEQFKETELANTVKYLPTAAIYKEGKLVAWLDAESDDNLPYYKSPEGFKKWLEQYITLDSPNE